MRRKTERVARAQSQPHRSALLIAPLIVLLIAPFTALPAIVTFLSAVTLFAEVALPLLLLVSPIYTPVNSFVLLPFLTLLFCSVTVL